MNSEAEKSYIDRHRHPTCEKELKWCFWERANLQVSGVCLLVDLGSAISNLCPVLPLPLKNQTGFTASSLAIMSSPPCVWAQLSFVVEEGNCALK